MKDETADLTGAQRRARAGSALAGPVWVDPAGQGDLFGDRPPAFELPPRAADRIGVVDVGSNSVRFVVFEGGRRCPSMMFNEKVQCGLGRDLVQSGHLSAAGVESAMAALHRFVELAAELRVGALAAVATAAVREAKDGLAFRDRVEAETKIPLQIASGADEAELAALGVLFGDPSAEGLVIDLGGASMELCPIAQGRPGKGVSTPLGPQRVGPVTKPSKTLAEIDAVLAPIAPEFAPMAARLHLVGGAWRAFGRIQIALQSHPLNVLHEFAIKPGAALKAAEFILEAEADALRDFGVPSGRLDTLPHAALLITALIRQFNPKEIQLSGFGLREGLCYRSLPSIVRMQDPLLSTASGHEMTRSRDPGFGSELAAWLLPVLGRIGPETERLVRAACHLVDVGWRVHPEYHSNACLDIVTRVTLSSAGHRGRAFILVCLLNRFKGGRKATAKSKVAQGLLDEDERALAMQIGKLMRLGVAMTGGHSGLLPRCLVTVEDTTLVLRPDADVRVLMGEEVVERLRSAARSRSLKHAIQ